jgi:hypothetical protein
VIINNEINIHIDTCVDIDICGNTPDGNVIIIVITGCIDINICVDVDVPVTIYNPCLDINFFFITTVVVPDFTCSIHTGTPCIFEHDPFMITAQTQVIFEMCLVVYTIDAGDLSIYITYDVDLHIIIIDCDDMGLVGVDFTYTITVTIAGVDLDCGLCGGCCGSSSGTIIIVSPCLGPVINIGITIGIDFNFNGPSIWNPPPCTVNPPVCYDYIIYTCVYVNGPYSGTLLDTCDYNFNDGIVITIVSFDFGTGIFVFETNDHGTFPAGTYVFLVTITIGDQVVEIPFTMYIISHCEVPSLTLNISIETSFYYTIGDPTMTIFTYDLSTIVTSSLTVNCGSPVIVIQDANGFAISGIFVHVGSSLTVYVDDVNFAGTYSMYFVFFYDGMPSVSISSNIFIVTVINICIPPPGCITIIGCGIPDPIVIPPTTITIDVTVTIDVSIDLPSWNCGTPGCDTQIIPVCPGCDDQFGVGVIVIVDTTINIHLDTCVGICGSDPNGTVIVIVIEGCLGDICEPVDCDVVIYNPCLDPDYFVI